MNKALFLDRDGIINERLIGAYVRTPEEFRLLHEVVPILTEARRLGYLLILITNQQGVGKGLMTAAELDRVSDHMQALLAEHNAMVDAIYTCTDLDSVQSPRRKPAPGMLLEAMADHELDASRCWFLGDSITDAQAGRSAGVRTALVGEFEASEADVVAGTLAQITPLLVGMLAQS